MATLTQFLKLYKPVTNEVGWDDNMNSNLDLIDSFIRQFMNIPNFVGVWTNGTAYAVSQVTMDPQTAAFYSCLVANTSPATGTFAQDRTARPTFWALNSNPVSDAANNAAASAAAAAASATAAANSLTSFTNTYYGSFATDPLTDPHGGARTAGDLYFNTTTQRLRVYSTSPAGWVEITTTFADAPTTPAGAVFVRTAAHTWVEGVAQTGGIFTGGIVLGGSKPTLGIGIVPPLAGVASNAYMGHLITQNVWAQNLYFSQTAPSPATGGWRYMTALPNPIPAAGALGAFVVNSVATGSTGFVGDRFTTFYSTPSGELAPADGVATLMPVMQFRTFKQGAPAVNTSTMAIFGQGFKPGGGTWGDSSDVRIKNIVGPYPHGLAELLEMLPQMFTYKGNDQMVAPDGTPGDVIHPDTVTQHIGLIAQECEPYMPELVTTTTAYVDGVLVNDVRQLDATGVIYALVNAVAQLNTMIGSSGGPFLPLAGGTLTGSLNGTSAVFSGILVTTGLQSNGGIGATGALTVSGSTASTFGTTGTNNQLSIIPGSTAATQIALTASGTGGIQYGASGGKAGFLGATPVVRPVVSGSRGGNTALASMLTAFAQLGLITDSSTA